jgi:hypothetical protein
MSNDRNKINEIIDHTDNPNVKICLLILQGSLAMGAEAILAACMQAFTKKDLIPLAEQGIKNKAASLN